jgi:hypothetical protein
MVFSERDDSVEADGRSVAAAEERRDETEADRRYHAGWIIGGYTFPVQDSIRRLGGLWLRRHRVWTMPDRESWLQIRSLLPGDF